MSPSTLQANPVYSQPFVPDLLHVPSLKEVAGRRMDAEDDKENVGKRPSWCRGPVWPRYMSLLYSNNLRNQAQHKSITCLVLLSAAWALVRSKSERRFLKLLRVIPQEGKICLPPFDNQRSALLLPLFTLAGFYEISKYGQKKVPSCMKGVRYAIRKEGRTYGSDAYQAGSFWESQSISISTFLPSCPTTTNMCFSSGLLE